MQKKKKSKQNPPYSHTGVGGNKQPLYHLYPDYSALKTGMETLNQVPTPFKMTGFRSFNKAELL